MNNLVEFFGTIRVKKKSEYYTHHTSIYVEDWMGSLYDVAQLKWAHIYTWQYYAKTRIIKYISTIHKNKIWY